ILVLTTSQKPAACKYLAIHIPGWLLFLGCSKAGLTMLILPVIGHLFGPVRSTSCARDTVLPTQNIRLMTPPYCTGSNYGMHFMKSSASWHRTLINIDTKPLPGQAGKPRLPLARYLGSPRR